MIKNKVINFNFENNCYGCRNCENICPQKAIKMVENQEGFLIPKIDYEKCVDCGLCAQKCPYLQVNKNQSLQEKKWYACYLIDEEKRKQSASGGIFAALADLLIKNDGYVCGCIWNENLEAVHIITNKPEEIEKMKGSKYVQSNLKDCAPTIQKMLLHHKVLFTGTPCQVAAIKKYVGNNENLYTMSVICKGVPSPKVWKKYVQNLEKNNKSKLLNVQFKNKEIGWEPPVMKQFFENGKITSKLSFSTDLYGIGFLQGLFYRNSCSNCQYKLAGYNADIVVGDFWGASKSIVQETNNKGVSAVLVNSKKGQELFSQIASQIKFYSMNEEDIIRENQMIIKSVTIHPNRNKFYENIDRIDINQNIRDNIILPVNKKLKNVIKELAYKTKTYDFIRKLIK